MGKWKQIDRHMTRGLLSVCVPLCVCVLYVRLWLKAKWIYRIFWFSGAVGWWLVPNNIYEANILQFCSARGSKENSGRARGRPRLGFFFQFVHFVHYFIHFFFRCIYFQCFVSRFKSKSMFYYFVCACAHEYNGNMIKIETFLLCVCVAPNPDPPG